MDKGRCARWQTRLGIAVLAVIAGLTTSAWADPDFSKVDDILAGKRLLLRTDDLIIAGRFPSGTNSEYTGAILKTSDSKVTSTSAFSNSIRLPASTGSNQAVATGRFFNLTHDSVVTVAVDWQAKVMTLVFDPADTSPVSLPVRLGLQYIAVAVADFTGDGWDDIVIAGGAPSKFGNQSGTLVRVVSAVDPAAPQKGLRSGPEWRSDSSDSEFPWGITAGDFNRDGRPEVAVLHSIDFRPYGGVLQKLGIHFFSVNPQSLTVTDQGRFDCNLQGTEGNSNVYSASLAGGRFGARSYDRLVVTYALQGSYAAKVIPVDFDTQGKPVRKATVDMGFTTGPSGRVLLRSGHIDWFSPYDQAVLMGSYANPGQTTVHALRILSFDPNFNVSVGPQTTLTTNCHHDVAVGNFDRRQANSAGRNPNLQVAFLTSDCGANAVVHIYNTDPGNKFAWTRVSSSPLPTTVVKTTPVGTLSLAAGDFQSRTLRLGEPTKATIADHLQPRLVIAAPPMHVDYITRDGTSPPELLNLTAYPDDFYTEYNVEQSSKNEATDQDTTSWSWGAAETVGASITFGDPDSSGIKNETTFAAQQTWEGSVDTAANQFQEQTFSIRQQTGDDDKVWYTHSQFIIYLYPVLNQKVCPAEFPNCREDQKQPLVLQIAGPKTLSETTIDGDGLEWYQPPWEFGNVFSYPANYGQLQEIIPDIDLLSAAESTTPTWFTDSGTLTLTSTWAAGSTKTQTVSSAQNFSEELTNSTTGAFGLKDIATVGGNLELKGSRSDAFGNLTTKVVELGKSAGISVTKPGGVFANPRLYQYAVTPFIFGQQPPSGVTHELPVSGDAKTFGVLRSAFTANPTHRQAGAWWSQAYTRRPDVGVGHPARWTATQDELGNTNVELSAARPDNPWLSEFHYLRGFFISELLGAPPRTCSAEGLGKGSQLSQATAGGTLLLQTRVFNYSLTKTPPGAVVHVRFYGQPWNPQNNTPDGNSFVIGEDRCSAIPPFSGEAGAPLNWVLTQAVFNTAAYADQYLTFWVVVWMETPDGKLVAEIPGHGVTSIPGSLKSLADTAPLTAAPEQYSNNVGFYHSVFYVAAKAPTGKAVLAAESTAKAAEPDASAKEPKKPKEPKGSEVLAIYTGPVKMSEKKVPLGHLVEVTTELRTGAQSADGVMVVFYDGDPLAGGKAFDMELVPHIRARDRYEVSVLFDAEECGERRIYVTAGAGEPSEDTRKSPPIEVECD